MAGSRKRAAKTVGKAGRAPTKVRSVFVPPPPPPPEEVAAEREADRRATQGTRDALRKPQPNYGGQFPHALVTRLHDQVGDVVGDVVLFDGVRAGLHGDGWAWRDRANGQEYVLCYACGASNFNRAVDFVRGAPLITQCEVTERARGLLRMALGLRTIQAQAGNRTPF